MTRFAKLLVSLSGAGALVTGCQTANDAADDFRNGVPRQETVAMVVPGAAGGQAQTLESTSQALRGETADFYKLTRGVSRLVNGGGAFVLGLVKAIVNHPPTTLEPERAIWGPWSEPLDPIEWRLTVDRVGVHKYSYKLDGRARKVDGAAFVTVLSGTHTASVDGQGHAIERFGNGDFTLDWDARNTLPNPEKDIGRAHYVYAHNAPGAGVEVDAQFRQVKDDERPGQRVDVDYRYRAMRGAGGSMEFVHAAPATMAGAGSRWSVKSRWKENGAGRSDVRASGGDLPPNATVTANECWDDRFASLYLRASWWPNAGWGMESDCVYSSAEYSQF